MGSSIYPVSPHAIVVDAAQVPSRDIRHQKARLIAEGQIEPIELVAATGQLSTHAWCYAAAQVLAARELGWATLLVTPRAR